MRKPTFAVLAAGLLALLAACGGGGDDEESSPSPTTAVASGQTGMSFTGNRDSRYCQLARTYIDSSRQLTESGGSPDALRTLYKDAERDINAAVEVAPAEIKNDARVVANGLTVLIAGFERANWDPARVSPDVFSAVATPEFQASASRVEAYTAQVCGAQR